MMDKPLAGYVVSVWADPDIGEASFFIVVESPDGGPVKVVPDVSMWSEPTNGRLGRTTWESSRQPLKNQLQFEAFPNFDQRDMWTVGFRVARPEEQWEEATTEVESTPPGYGYWDFTIYLFPFLLLAVLWVMAVVRRRRIGSI